MMRIHNHINQRNHPKYNGYPSIMLSVCGVNTVLMYTLGRNKQIFNYMEAPLPLKGVSIVGIPR